VKETAVIRGQHVAALLAWHRGVERSGALLMVKFDHGPTAFWLSQALSRPGAELLDVGGNGGVVCVRNPQIVLGRYGYRDGRWMFGQGMDAGLGIGRGAVHAAGVFSRRGLRIDCPIAVMMLTLTAVLGRLGIKASPSNGQPAASITAANVPAALERLGIGRLADPYRRLRDANGKDTQA
jgi:hypothetical protein